MEVSVKKIEMQKRIEFHKDLMTLLQNNLPEKDVNALRKIIADYFIDKLNEEMEKLEEEKGWTKETYDQWLNEKS